VLHLVSNLLVALLLVAGSVGVHLVDADDQLLDTQQVDQAGVLAGLALDLTGLCVSRACAAQVVSKSTGTMLD
jgi:hypothetical protein